MQRAFFTIFMLLLATSAQAAHYEAGKLEIQALQVGEQRYHIVLRHQGQLIFNLDSLQASQLAQPDAIYDPHSGRLQIEQLQIGDQTVRAELFALDNGTFMGTLLNYFPSPSKTDNYNAEAVIPAMCYTNTEGRYNPCYTCHQAAINGINHENRMDDGDLQGDYTFSDLGQVNRWENLFIDRSSAVAAISDDEILAYINQDNYSSLAGRLKDFQGWIPDLENLHDPTQAFAADGFARDGSYWVAFNYKPLPSTFWPTNGSTDDVMIRLPAPFRSDREGHYSKPIYQANLAIVEAAIKDLREISVPPLDENAIGVDINGDGQLSEITQLQRPSHYLGGAADIEVVTFLYPKGTEFLHTVRYIGVDAEGNIYNAPRMKEVRYMKKFRFYSKPILGGFYAEEQFEKYQGAYPYYNSRGDKGLDNSYGWRLQAFIENADGELRPQTYEETFFCMGCHSTIGGTIDKVFSFTRKIDGAEGWGYIDLKGMPDVPAKGETEGEFLKYLRLVGGGDEFRQNEEMILRWFLPDGSLNEAAVKNVADIYELITPSRERALILNKAYRVIVKEQSYIRGRDASVTPATRVLHTVDTNIPPLPPDKRVKRDMRLDWALYP
jgi:hypothetical protein